MTRRARLTGLLVGLVALLFLGRWTAGVLTDHWWAARFSPGAAAFLTERHLLRLLLDLAAVLVAAGWFIGHLYAVSRAIGRVEIPRHVGNVEFHEAVTSRGLVLGAILTGLLLGMLVGGGASDGWATVELAWHGLRYGLSDPVLGQDAGFYVAQLPLWRGLHAYALLLTLLALTGTLTLYILVGAVRWMEGRPAINGHARLHLGWLLATLAVMLAWGYLLEPYELVAGIGGPLDPGLVRLTSFVSPALAGTALGAAILSAVWAARAQHTLLVAAWAILIAASGLGHYVLPAVAREREAPVAPAEVSRLFLHAAYGPDSLVEAAYPADTGMSGPPAIPSLWDREHARLAISPDTQALAALAPAVLRLDDGAHRPVWLGVVTRERGPAVLALADDRVGPTGAPLFYHAGDESGDTAASPRPDPLLELSRHVIRPGAPEFDLGPDALGGPVGAWPRRLVLAWTLQLGRLLGAMDPADRLAWHLEPQERLAHLAPFATWGAPEPRLLDGELVWIAPGYVRAALFPLSPRVEWEGTTVGAVRAGFVGLVRAASGDARIYLRGDADPLARAWGEIAAGTVEPAGTLPAEIAAEVGYPRELLDTQLGALEQGAFGRVLQRTGGEAGQRTPILGWAPDTSAAEWSTGIHRLGETGLAALLSARADQGRDVVHLWRLDSAATLPVPAQLARSWARFPLFTQLRDSVTANQGDFDTGAVRLARDGAGVVAYQPAYGRSADGRIALLWVSVATGDRLGAGRTMADAWQNLLGTSVATPPGRHAAAPTSDPLALAREWMQRADSAMRQGDWVRFGRALEALRQVLGVPARR
ncbi:MAG TPA: UPF0182 family protein [Gemmatimonadales bacterium]|nr:UPF0182 family protein [Gemmatimonadales bacterium]